MDGGVPAGRFREGETFCGAVMEETSAVDVSGQHPCRESGNERGKNRARSCAHEQECDLVKRCDQPGKVLIQLESLILAQSERWRQA